MNSETLIRFWMAVAVIASGLAAAGLINWLTLTRASANVRGLPSYRPGRPAILYFTTPACAPCKTVQRPAIHKVHDLFGESLQVVEIDASLHPRLASDFGVLSVPTTFLLDAHGRPRHVNHGVADTEKLINQLKGILK